MVTKYSYLESCKYLNYVIKSVYKQFPKTCNCCGKYFENFNDFIENTYISNYTGDNNVQILKHLRYEDVIAYRNCRCHSTMVIRCILEEHEKKEFLNAVKNDVTKFKLDEKEILKILRNIILKKTMKRRLIRATREDIQPSLI